MKRFTLILSLMVAMVTTAMAQIDVTKAYRIKDVTSGEYLTAFNHDQHDSGTNGGVGVAALEENSKEQVFYFEPTSNGYFLRLASGDYYVVGWSWNVDAIKQNGTIFNFEDAGEGNVYLKKGSSYFKIQEVNSKKYVFCDAPESLRATWVLEVAGESGYATYNTFNPNKAYVLKTRERGGMTINDDATAFCSTNDAARGTFVEHANNANHFAVITYKDEYYLYSVKAKMFLNADKSLTASVGDAVAFRDAKSEGASRMSIYFKDVANANINIGGNNEIQVNSWSPVDHGNAMLFIEVADFDPTEALEVFATITYEYQLNGKTLATQEAVASKGEAYPELVVPVLPLGVVVTGTKPADKVTGDVTVTITLGVDDSKVPFAYYSSYSAIENWYYVKLKGANYLYHEAGKGHIALDQTAVAADNKDAFSWAFIGDPVNGFQLVNKAAGQGYVLSSTTSITDDANTYPVMTASPVAEGNNELWVLTASTYQTNGFYMAQKGFASNRMNNRNNKLAYWTGGADNGSTFTVELRPTAKGELLALAAQAETLLAQITIGEAIGQYSSNYEGYAAAYAEIATYVEGGEIEEAVAEEYVATLSAIMNSFSVNGLVAGKYYTFSNGGYYITSGLTKNSDNADRIACSETKDATAIYYFDGQHLLAYSTGLYFGLNANDWTFEAVGSTDISKITFAAVNGGTANVLNICSGGRWLHRTDAFVNRCTNNTCGNAHNWTIEEVTSLPVSITAAGYATFFAPVTVTVADGVTAYTVKVDGDVAELNEIGATIPANTAVVLAGAEKAYDFAITTDAAFDGENDLRGTVAATNITEAAYVLGNAKGIGFYAAKMTDGAWLNNSHKAYLPMTDGVNAASYSFRFGEGTTGVENVEVENEVKAIFDLTGRRVEAITAPGIYIINGKKTLVK